MPDNPQEPLATEGTPVETPVTPTPEEKVFSRAEYTGLQTKLNKRNEAFQALEKQFDTINVGKTQAEQLAEKHFQTLTATTQRVTELSTQMAPLNSLALKVSAFKELIADPKGLNLPADAALKLFNLLDDIPAGQDVETTKATILKFAAFGQTLASDREKEVTQGVTPGFAGGQPGDGLPTTHEGWAQYVAGASPSDPKWGQYFNWVQNNQG